MMLPVSASSSPAVQLPVQAALQVSGSTGSQLSVVSFAVGQTTEWEVPADVEYVKVQL